MAAPLPQSVLFCCDHNAVRSPMAEGMMKKLYGTEAYVQSAGLIHDLDIDGFAIAVCAEIGVELGRHRVRDLHEMEEMGEALSGFDLVVALSEGARDIAAEMTARHAIAMEYWPILDPTGTSGPRAEKLAAYRAARDQIHRALTDKWGTP
ncbi:MULTISPECIES: arsenate-mycothiol transferase ArsC [unclassified Roseivivax]|uniref:arsenate-mycothiol transferase ArsC n=1 Tax=Roseivivax sp. GX 12232 TaxID=2900547 RepID=UPI001E452EC3|nr:low molecular weight phosphatase family protein [Roseivivax sp. GX 12232]MCE0504151.1 low molecular weight phosphatase family protein [Roseivivax sp. GX 12232]